MQKFEYCVRTLSNLANDAQSVPGAKSEAWFVHQEGFRNISTLSQMGEQGWELTHVADEKHFIFKRRNLEGKYFTI